ncbi:DUF4328 domain-containing protein [Pelagerythrobacter sp.]|uniref:DUF4328 domain-containing protein n=1 Tax=Pelagerythrobacter sp. TaxID=2800702 RepID=UPI0035B1C592
MNTELQQGLAILEKRAATARFLIVAVAGLTGVHLIGLVLVTSGSLSSDAMFVGDWHVVDLIGIPSLIAIVASIVAVAMWIHRAHANLAAADLHGLDYTPGWAVGWYFVPIANLFKPFQAMRELWNASHGALGDYKHPAPGLLWVWWLTWIFSNLSSSGDSYETIDLIGLALTAVSAGCLYMIVNTITRRQHSMDIAETFA